MVNKRVVITGMGPLSSLGRGCDETWNSILNKDLNVVKESYLINDESWGEFYLHKMRNFDINDFELSRKNFNFIKELRTVQKEDLDLYYLLAVVKLAIDHSGLKYDPFNNNVGIIVAHENPGVEIFFEELVEWVSESIKRSKGKNVSKLDIAKMLYEAGCEKRGYNLQSFSYLFSVAKVFDIHGYSLFINNACASGLFAIEAAAMQIKSGRSPAVIVAAADNPNRIYKYLWFKNHGLYAEDGIAKPFSADANGAVFGDGGAALVLEDLDNALSRGAKIYGEYLGGGFSLEGWKITVPDVTEDFYARSFKEALKNAGIQKDHVDFINPHGVGMKLTDRYEAKTIRDVFGEKAPPVSAFKPLVGHNLGGSALLELVIAILAMKENMIPATLNCENEDKDIRLDIVKKDRQKDIKTIAKMSFGFAGFNGVSIFGKAS